LANCGQSPEGTSPQISTKLLANLIAAPRLFGIKRRAASREARDVAMSQQAHAKHSCTESPTRFGRRVEIGIGLTAIVLALATAFTLFASPRPVPKLHAGQDRAATAESSEEIARQAPRYWGPFRP
jgi:hypothetical protein